MRVLAIVRAADRGSARGTRAVLLDAGEGTTPFDLLAARRFHDARRAVGQGRAGAHDLFQRSPGLVRRPRLRASHCRRRSYYDAKSDRVHREPGRARAARAVRIRAMEAID